MIYFIAEKPRPNCNCEPRIKIGVSKNVKQRLSTLRTASADELEVKLILITDDDYAVENFFHDYKFRGDHIRREWFAYSDDIKDFVKEHQAGQGQYSVYRPESRRSWGRLFVWTLIVGSGLICAASIAVLTIINKYVI